MLSRGDKFAFPFFANSFSFCPDNFSRKEVQRYLLYYFEQISLNTISPSDLGAFGVWKNEMYRWDGGPGSLNAPLFVPT